MFSAFRRDFGSRLDWQLLVGMGLTPSPSISQMHQLPRPRVVPLAMGDDSCKFHPAMAPPAYPGCANDNTRKRRMQRKHPAASYKFLKARLFQCLQPMPSLALYSACLESLEPTFIQMKRNIPIPQLQLHHLQKNLSRRLLYAVGAESGNHCPSQPYPATCIPSV